MKKNSIPNSLPYDKTSRESILAYARKLLGHSLRELHPGATVKSGGRGGLGQTVEIIHFGYGNNSDARPDFEEAGLELKCTPLKLLKDGSAVAKERLVLNLINYIDEARCSFTDSSFWKKNENLLLMFYQHAAHVDKAELLFRLIRNWSIPAEDLKIFQDDWAIIHRKIASGRAQDIHEGDTFYLAACEKGSTAGKEMREQLGTNQKAQQRAYSIKKCYMDQIVLESLLHPEMYTGGLKISAKKRRSIEKKRAQYGAIVRAVNEYLPHETFEDLVMRRFRPYLGKTAEEIAKLTGASISSAKSISINLCRGMLGVKEREIAEFKKAGVILKTIRLEHSGSLAQAMSFSTIKYNDIINEERWETSEWHDIVTRKFLFVVFRKSVDKVDSLAKLEDIFFWSMPGKDVVHAEKLWSDTKRLVLAGDYNHFTRSTENPVCHVRPKARKAADTTVSPQGTREKKMCYWLNSAYVKKIVATRMQRNQSVEPEILSDVAEALRYYNYLPVYTLQAACGKFRAEESVEPEGWIRVHGVRARNENLYVVRAVGHSMEPGIHDGEYKAFEFRHGACDNNDIVLVEHSGVVDDETSGAYSIKKYTRRVENGSRVEVTLVPTNRDYPSIPLTNNGEFVHDYRVVGTLRNEIKVG